MQRVPEPELMDEAFQVKAYAAADFSDGDHALIADLADYLCSVNQIPHQGSMIIDIGCGPGNISEGLARYWPDSTVVGIDGSEAMLAVAKDRQQKASPDLKRLSYRCLNISAMASSAFALASNAHLIVSNSLIHHLHNPDQLWMAIKNLAAPGAVVFHRDLRRPSTSEQAAALQLKHLPHAPAVLIKDYLASLHAAFTVEEIRAQLVLEGLDHLKVVEIEDRYLQVSGRL